MTTNTLFTLRMVPAQSEQQTRELLTSGDLTNGALELPILPVDTQDVQGFLWDDDPLDPSKYGTSGGGVTGWVGPAAVGYAIAVLGLGVGAAAGYELGYKAGRGSLKCVSGDDGTSCAPR